MQILLEDFSDKMNKEDTFSNQKPTIVNGSLQEISNGNGVRVCGTNGGEEERV
jgi:hypothetical protein